MRGGGGARYVLQLLALIASIEGWPRRASCGVGVTSRRRGGGVEEGKREGVDDTEGGVVFEDIAN